MRTVDQSNRSPFRSLALAVLLAATARAVSADPYPIQKLFPGVVSAGGANGTQWRSEAVLANPTGASSDLLLEVIPRDGSAVIASMPLTLAASETRRLPDLYEAMGIASGAGTLRVTGDALVWVRTFNRMAQGTFGMDDPGVDPDEGFAAGVPVLFPMNNPADQAKDFRSNLLVLNLEARPVTLTLASGAATRTLDVPAGTFTQIDRVGGWLGAQTGASMLYVTSTGRWFGVVTTIDPVLGDPTGIRGLVATARDSRLFAGVASASGVNGTRWRSQAYLYNPRMSPQSARLELTPRGGSSVVATKSIALAPLELRFLPDLYAALGADSGAGSLRVTGDVLTWVRTFNQGSTATFGTDIPEVTPGTGYGSGAVVAFPVSSPADIGKDFRSNFLVYNHEARPITCTFTAEGASGTLGVPAGSFVQSDNLGATLGLPAGTHSVKVRADGRWSAIVTAIDPYLGDPTTVLGALTTPNPAPTPRGAASGSGPSASIGSSGGTLTSGDGRLRLTVPPGALSATRTLTIQPVTNEAWGGLGAAYELGPSGTTFASPATLTFTPSAADSSAVNLAGMGIGFQDADGYWWWDTSATRDASSVSVQTSHLSSWSLLSGLVLQPQNASVGTGDRLDLKISECYPPALEPLDDNDPLAPLVPGVPCEAYPFYKSINSRWAVNQFDGGNATFGTIQGAGSTGHFTAPPQAPSPSTVAVSAEVRKYLNLSNVRVISMVTIGGGYRGTFQLALTRADGLKVSARGEATLTPFRSDDIGTSYDMTGTITIDGSFGYYGMTCTCVESLKKPIPADTVFAIQRKPSLGQRWVMGGVVWNFTCSPGNTTMPVALQYFVAPKGDCSQQSWVNLPDESHPSGSFTSECNPAFSVAGSWEFAPN